jgi:hypothetical protein
MALHEFGRIHVFEAPARDCSRLAIYSINWLTDSLTFADAITGTNCPHFAAVAIADIAVSVWADKNFSGLRLSPE